jgi:hypothetical protein
VLLLIAICWDSRDSIAKIRGDEIEDILSPSLRDRVRSLMRKCTSSRVARATTRIAHKSQSAKV